MPKIEIKQQQKTYPLPMNVHSLGGWNNISAIEYSGSDIVRLLLLLSDYYCVAPPLGSSFSGRSYPYCNKFVRVYTLEGCLCSVSASIFYPVIPTAIIIADENYSLRLTKHDFVLFIGIIEKYLAAKYRQRIAAAGVVADILPQPIAEEIAEYL